MQDAEDFIDTIHKAFRLANERFPGDVNGMTRMSVEAIVMSALTAYHLKYGQKDDAS